MRASQAASHTRGMDTPASSLVDPVADLPGGARVLAGAPRTVRHLEPPEAPWPGCLATDDEASCFLVDARTLDGWAGWDSDSDGHVLAPLDLVRRADGHDVMLPLCTERLARFLQRRAGRGVPLSPGEAVTVLVSVLRGTAEVLARGPDAAGEWWLTDAGKPVFVHTEGPDAVLAADLCLVALGDVLPDVAELRARLGAVDGPDGSAPTADLTHPRALGNALPEIEAALFARSAPEPLATTDLAPARARAIGAIPDHADDILAQSRRRRWSPLARFVDSDLRDVVAAGWDAWRETRRRDVRRRHGAGGGRRPRRRMVVVATAVGAAVVAVGLLWPNEEPVSADSRRTAVASPGAGTPRVPAPARSASSSPSASGTSSAPGPAGEIRAMLAARIACGGDSACRGAFLEDPGLRVPAGAIDAAGHAVVLLDDFGGAAVVRVTSAEVTGSGRSQLVVAVRSEDEWLIRDVRDVADQPK